MNDFTQEELQHMIDRAAEAGAIRALEKIQNDDYCDVIASRYFDGLTITEISDIYDCKYQNISKKRNKLIKILAAELFPEDVLKELLER